jgi:hypothetical protein
VIQVSNHLALVWGLSRDEVRGSLTNRLDRRLNRGKEKEEAEGVLEIRRQSWCFSNIAGKKMKARLLDTRTLLNK